DRQTRSGTLRQVTLDWLDEEIVEFGPRWIPLRRQQDRIVAARGDIRRRTAAFFLAIKRGRRSYELFQLYLTDVDPGAAHNAVRRDRPDVQRVPCAPVLHDRRMQPRGDGHESIGTGCIGDARAPDCRGRTAKRESRQFRNGLRLACDVV